TPEADGASFAKLAMAARPAANVPAVALSISSSGNEESSSSSRSSLAGSMSLLVPFMLEKIVRGMHLRMTKLKIAGPPLFHGLAVGGPPRQVLSAVDGNCHTGHARGMCKIEDPSCDVVGSRTALERRAFRLRRKLGIGLAWAWKRRPRRDSIDPDPRRQRLRQRGCRNKERAL